MNQIQKFVIQLVFLLFLPFAMPLKAQTDSIATLEASIPDAKTDKELFDIYLDLADKLHIIDPAKGIGYAHKTMEYAAKINNENSYAGANVVLAQNLIYAGYPDSARPYAYEAYRITQKGNTPGYNFSSINTLGNLYDALSVYDSTIYYYQKALDLAIAQNDKSNMAAAYNNLGMTVVGTGDLKKGYEYYLEALNLFELLGQLDNVAIALNNIALVNQRNDENEKAIGYLKRAVEININRENFYHLSMNYSNLGISYKELESYDSALYYYQKSHELTKKYNYDNDYARYYFNLGNLYYKKEDFDSARVYFDKSLRVSEEQGIKLGALFNSVRLFDLEIKDGKIDQAKIWLQTLEDAIIQTGQTSYNEELILRKSIWFEKNENLREALDTYKAYHHYTDSIQDLEFDKTVAELREKYETEKKAIENQQLRDDVLLKEKTIQYQYLLVVLIAVVLMFAIIIAVTLFKSKSKLAQANNELTKLNNEVNQQKVNLEEANETKDKMFSIIAHDLRSPFNTLLGFLDLLVSEYDDLDDDEKKSLLKTLNSQSIKTYGLLENLLQWSMMQRGLVKLHIKNYNLHEIVMNQLGELYQRAVAKKVELVNSVHQSTEIKADEMMIRTILRNLIINSIKFSHEGKQINVKAEKTSGTLKLCVEDQGVGMTQEYANRLFTRQIAESKPGTGDERGTGLGLRIVRDFVDMMDGEIQVNSSPGEGTVFCVIFKNQ